MVLLLAVERSTTDLKRALAYLSRQNMSGKFLDPHPNPHPWQNGWPKGLHRWTRLSRPRGRRLRGKHCRSRSARMSLSWIVRCTATPEDWNLESLHCLVESTGLIQLVDILSRPPHKSFSAKPNTNCMICPLCPWQTHRRLPRLMHLHILTPLGCLERFARLRRLQMP